jgi:hypothetical protein
MAKHVFLAIFSKEDDDWDFNSLTIGEAIIGLPFSQHFRLYFDMHK